MNRTLLLENLPDLLEDLDARLTALDARLTALEAAEPDIEDTGAEPAAQVDTA